MEPSDAVKNQSLIRDVHQLRKRVQGIINEVDSGYTSREASLAKTKLQEAKHWLGELLGALGSELPKEYKDDPED